MRIVSQVNGSREKIRRGQAVKAIFRRSKILTPVAALYTAPMGVTPPCVYTAASSEPWQLHVYNTYLCYTACGTDYYFAYVILPERCSNICTGVQHSYLIYSW